MESIVERGVALYEKQARRVKGPKDPLGRILTDPERRDVLSEVMSAIGQRSGSRLTKDEREKRAKDAAKARAEKLTPEQRKAIAKAAAEKRWRSKKKSS